MSWFFWKKDKQLEMRSQLGNKITYNLFVLSLFHYFETEILTVDFMREMINKLNEDDRADLERFILRVIKNLEQNVTSSTVTNSITYVEDRMILYYKYQFEMW